MNNHTIAKIQEISESDEEDSIGLSWMVGSKPLFWTVIVSTALMSAYSVNLPLMRWKRSIILTTLSCGITLLLSFTIGPFLHMKTFVLKKAPSFPRSMLVGSLVMGCFYVIITISKDLADVEGDKAAGLKNLAIRLGVKQVFWLCISLIQMAYGIAITLGALSPVLWSKFVTESNEPRLVLEAAARALTRHLKVTVRPCSSLLQKLQLLLDLLRRSTILTAPRVFNPLRFLIRPARVTHHPTRYAVWFPTRVSPPPDPLLCPVRLVSADVYSCVVQTLPLVQGLLMWPLTWPLTWHFSVGPSLRFFRVLFPSLPSPIPVILNGSNYGHWVEAMRDFLKGRKLWRYVTGDVVCPVKSTVITTSIDGTSKSTEVVEKEFVEKLEVGIVRIIGLLLGFATLPLQVFI
ncbi:hypoxanthine-guanine phosphoribosyltransferase [Stylosanthes scabra]|uniref:Hypoxanthine-guanine phosphoribosyltransferase n=1 Tax=Stylosanthes scabra TaxID=79078 RepID=A0ABU6ZLN0_9FABA|nr:hypoxanthine-guanine phosphoribosyltransferase [Stylosanthes scabra]